MIDEHSETWRAVKAWAEAYLGRACTYLETPGADVVKTENARGQILALRALLRLPEPKPEIPAITIAD